MRRAVIIGTFVSMLAACGGATTAGTTVVDDPEMAVETIAGLRLATVPRSTPGLVHLALFVDAGSRDASPPQLATAASWAAGEGLGPRVLPDGTVFEVSCEVDALEGCMRQLAGALGTRQVSSDVAALHERLVAVRRRAHTEEGRAGDLLALAAVLGDDAASFSPLGDAEDDDDVTASALEAFFADHYGPTRATLVAAGDVTGGGLRDAVRSAFTGAANALALREERSLDVDQGVHVNVTVGDQTVTSAALATQTGAAATSIARTLAEAERTGDAAGARMMVYGFGVRGGGLVIVRMAGRRPAEAGRRLVSALGRAALEAPPPQTIALPPDPRDSARLVGNAWLSGAGVSRDGAEIAIGIGAVVAGGRADAVSESDPDAPVRERAERFLSRAVDDAWAHLSPELRGDQNDDGAAVALADNGARVDVVRRPADTDVAVAVRFLGGGAADPPALHGRAALLAELSATACGRRSAAALREHLSALGASIAPLIDAESHGVVLRGPREHAFALVDLALACGLSPSLERADLVEARLSAIARVDPIEEVAAAALAESMPGLVAPRGTVGTIQSVSQGALSRELEASRVGARTSVAIVGAVDVEEVVARTARRLSSLAGGTLPSARELDAPDPSRIVPFEAEGSIPRVVFALMARGPSRPDVGAASAFAAELAQTLSRTADIRAGGVRAGGGADVTWLAVALDLSEEHIDTMPERVRAAVERTAGIRLDDAMAQMEGEARWADAEPAVAAARLCRERLLGAREGGTSFSGLGPAVFAIGRPR